MAIGKRKRFEVLKRDLFCCRYCGANATTTILHVDHVVAMANGGSDEMGNLVTACISCNQGKSDIPLESIKQELRPSVASVLQQAEDVMAYVAACQELQDAKESAIGLVLEAWDVIHSDGPSDSVFLSLPYWIATIGLKSVLEAVEATVTKDLRSGHERYFIACMRNIRDRAKSPARRVSPYPPAT